MSEAIQLDDYIDETRGDSYLSRAITRESGGSGGAMDDVLKRLGAVESSVSELRVQVSGIAAGISHLATKDELREVRGDINAVAANIPYLATKDELRQVRGDISAIAANISHLAPKSELSAMETRIIKWIIATVLTATGLAFSIAKFVH